MATTATALPFETIQQIARESGADDVGIVSVHHPDLADEWPFIQQIFPRATHVIGFVKRMAAAPVRSPLRSVANLEFHAANEETAHVARKIAAELTERGFEAMATPPGFPMEIGQFPGRTWVVSHKRVAEACGLGRMGIHRNVIHPKFGNFILLDSVLVQADVDQLSEPLDYNPCLTCKLCVAVCPVGAISPDGAFDSVACLNHNYREFMGGFIDWVDHVRGAPGSKAYDDEFSDQETASVWQSLAVGPNYKSAYCMAVCPAGDDIIGRFLPRKAEFVQEVVKPLQAKVEPVYVVANSDAEAYVRRRFPHKRVRVVGSGVRPHTIEAFLRALPLAFQRGQSKGIRLRFRFQFTGSEVAHRVVEIADQKVTMHDDLSAPVDLTVMVDARSWIRFLAKKVSLPRLLLTRKLRFRGDLRRLNDFARCFPL